MTAAKVRQIETLDSQTQIQASEADNTSHKAIGC